jgi:hypothetical protein
MSIPSIPFVTFSAAQGIERAAACARSSGGSVAGGGCGVTGATVGTTVGTGSDGGGTTLAGGGFAGAGSATGTGTGTGAGGTTAATGGEVAEGGAAGVLGGGNAAGDGSVTGTDGGKAVTGTDGGKAVTAGTIAATSGVGSDGGTRLGAFGVKMNHATPPSTAAAPRPPPMTVRLLDRAFTAAAVSCPGAAGGSAAGIAAPGSDDARGLMITVASASASSPSPSVTVSGTPAAALIAAANSAAVE